MRLSKRRIECNGAGEIGLGAVPVAVVLHLDVSERPVGARKLGFDLERLQHCITCAWHCFSGRPHAKDTQNHVAIGKTLMRQRELRIALQCLLKISDSERKAFLGGSSQSVAAIGVEKIGCRISCATDCLRCGSTCSSTFP